MDLITLNKDNRQPERLIENYDSLLWTERFNSTGDFQLVTGDVSTFMSLLPEGTLLSLRESNAVMIVETHKIERKKNQTTKLTITGRSFDSVLERRVAINAGPEAEWNVIAKTPSDVAYYIMNYICVMGTLHVRDIFPSSLVQFITPADYLTGSGPNRSFSVPKGNLLSAVQQFVQASMRSDPTTSPVTPKVEPHGLRAVRPDSSDTAIGMEIYKGTAREDSVYFDATRELLDDGTYLFSKVNSATTAYTAGNSPWSKIFVEAYDPLSLSALDRRVMLVDVSSAGNILLPQITELAKMSLYESSKTAIFDGSINEDLSPYLYGLDYNLGDTVKLVGDYGLDQISRVTEYIRSEDESGFKSYPTLVTIDDWL